MEQRDYIKRQIEQIGIMLQHILNRLSGLNGNGSSPEVMQICDEMRDGLSIDIDTLLAMSPEDVAYELHGNGFDYEMLLRFLSVLDALAAALPESDPRKQKAETLRAGLSVSVQKLFSTAEFQFWDQKTSK